MSDEAQTQCTGIATAALECDSLSWRRAKPLAQYDWWWTIGGSAIEASTDRDAANGTNLDRKSFRTDGTEREQ